MFFRKMALSTSHGWGHPPFMKDLMLFNTGYYRNSHEIQKSPKSDKNLLEIKRLASDFLKIPIDKQREAFPQFLRAAWEFKKKTSFSVTNERLDKIYQEGRMAGASAGKLLGAGGGGYFLFCVDPKHQPNVRRLLSNIGLVELSFTLDPHGTTLNDSIFL